MQELEDKLRQLATASRTSGQLTSPGASIDLARPNTASIETQTEPGPSQANPITVETGDFFGLRLNALESYLKSDSCPSVMFSLSRHAVGDAPE